MIKVLNGLRGYAALFVLLSHLPQVTSHFTGALIRNGIGFSRIGYISVDIFFVLSGFLITRNLIKEKDETGTISFKRFYYKRFLRIFPIYYITILLVSFVISTKNLTYPLLYLSNYFFAFETTPNSLMHTWSLAVEEHFYLAWPTILLILPKKFIKNNIFIFSVGLIVLSIITFYYSFPIDTFRNLVGTSSNTRIISLIGGGILAYYESTIRNVKNHSRYLTFALVCFLISSISRLPLGQGVFYELILYIFSFLGSITFMIYVLNLENRNCIGNKLLTNRYALFLGLISYGLYLYHYPIYFYYGLTNLQMKVKNPNFVGISEIVLSLILSFLIPIISYYIIEKPLIKIKNRI